MFDYEHAAGMHHWNGRLATRVLVPDAIPEAALARYGMRPPRLVRYPGLKEEYYLADARLDPAGVRAELGLDERLVAVLRPPPEVTLYHRGHTGEVFAATLERLLGRPRGAGGGPPAHRGPARGPRAAARPSCPSGRSTGRAWWPPRTWWSAPGGTMNREAAVLGVPAYSPFAARLGAVDRRLIADGRLRRLERAEDVRLARRDPAARAGLPRPRMAPRPDPAGRRADCRICLHRRGWGTRLPGLPVRSPSTGASLTRAWRRYAHRLGQIAVDMALVAAAYWLAFFFRFDGDPRPRFERLFLATVLIVMGLKLVVFVAARFYTKWWRFTSMRDLQAIVLATLASSLLVIAVLSLYRPNNVVPVPRGVFAFDLLFTLTFIGGVRFAVRSVVERPSRGQLVPRGREVLICGAGDAGNSILREMKRNHTIGYSPVGLIDDDPRKRGMRVLGTRVLGTRHDLPRLLRDVPIDEVIIAMPSAPGGVRQEIVEACRAADVACTTLPGLYELIRGEVTLGQLREVRVEDVLGARRWRSTSPAWRAT